MARSFVKLFDLEILHDYYVTNKCADFQLIPTADTLKHIKGYRSLLKISSLKAGQKGMNGISVAYEKSGVSPLVPIEETTRFRFGLKQINPALLNYTELTPKTNQFEVYYYTNSGGASLAESLIELQPKVFNYAFNSAGSPDELRVFDPDGTEIVDLRAPLTGGPDYKVQLDLLPYADGKYKLELFDGGVTIGEFKEIYFDDSLRAESVFGIIEIVADDNTLTPASLNIQFTKSESKWRYFVVFRKGAGGASYFVHDAEFGGPVMTFQEKTDYDTEELAFKNVLQYDLPPGGEIKMYRMDGNFACSEGKKKEIQLSKNSIGGPVVIWNLPNPEILSPKPYMIVFI